MSGSLPCRTELIVFCSAVAPELPQGGRPVRKMKKRILSIRAAGGLSLADTGNRWCVPMNQRVLVATPDENGWRVRLNGIEVVSFFGPHAREWALQEREELAQLLNAVACDDPSDRDGVTHPFRPVQ
jgi:hypothetical protein